jgi:hypothetical protein
MIDITKDLEKLALETTKLELSLRKTIDSRITLLKENFKPKEIRQELSNIRAFIKSDKVKDLFNYSLMMVEYKNLLEKIEKILDNENGKK